MEHPENLLVSSNRIDGNGIALDISVESAGWEFCGLTVWTLAPGGSLEAQTGEDEVCIVLLGGNCTVTVGQDAFELNSRASIFTGPPSAVYLPIHTSYDIIATEATEIAVCKSRATRTFPLRYIGPGDSPIEIRGAGNAARQINHIIKPDFPADRLLVVEVFTPSGNWSSYPPHKHDVSRMP
ncbi:MAG: 5-deoxy-glucuronate isomerase, partial [Thermomicrobiales bacterium]